MQTITPFMWFDHQAEEAMNFYVSVFKGAGKDAKVLGIQRYPEGPLEEPMKGMEGKVLTGVFELDGQQFMALDGGPVFQPSGAISNVPFHSSPCKVARSMLPGLSPVSPIGMVSTMSSIRWL